METTSMVLVMLLALQAERQVLVEAAGSNTLGDVSLRSLMREIGLQEARHSA